MKKIFLLIPVLLFYSITIAQNIGINFSAPRFPLSFPPVTGEKISLWDDGNLAGNIYGIGMGTGLLQFHTYTVSDDIVMGFGRSTSLNEKFRFKGNGHLGIGVTDPFYAVDVNSRFQIRNRGGNTPAGIVFDGTLLNTSPTMYAGMLTDNTVGFATYGIYPASYQPLSVNTTTGNVGIGTNNANYPLTFNTNQLGVDQDFMDYKVSLYPGSTGKVGFSMGPVSMYIHSDNPNADIAFGYDQYSNGFNERFAVKPSGALSVMGNTGNAGDFLISNGGSAAYWQPQTFITPNLPQEVYSSNSIIIAANDISSNFIPGLSASIPMSAAGKIRIDYELTVEGEECIACGQTTFEIIIVRNGIATQIFRDFVDNKYIKMTSGRCMFDVSAGTNVFDLYVRRISGPAIKVGTLDPLLDLNYMTYEIVD
jgi:hypothetical protein